MSVSTAAPANRGVSGQYRRSRLFAAGALGLCMAGINAALRANTASDLQRIFLDPIDKAHSAEMIASILGLPFLGFAVTIAIGSPVAGLHRDGPAAAALRCVPFARHADDDLRRRSGVRRGSLYRSVDRGAGGRDRLGLGRDGGESADRLALSR